MGVNIEGISYYLPEKELTNEELARKFGITKEEIYKKTGIIKRHISGSDEFGSDMAIKAAKILFEEYNIDKDEIDFIIYCSETLDYRAPATACIIHEELGLKKGAGAIDIPLGCTGFTYSYMIAEALLKGKTINKVLLLNTDNATKVIHPDDLELRMIFGDAATATLLSYKENTPGFISVFGTDGSGKDNLIVRRSASKDAIDIKWLKKYESAGGMPYGKMEMNSLEIFTFTLREVPPLIEQILDKNNLHIEDINLFIFHQANAFLLNTLRRKLKIPEDKFFIYLEHVGNTVSASIPIALKEAIKQGKAKKGDKILLAAFGIGYSWCGTVITV